MTGTTISSYIEKKNIFIYIVDIVDNKLQLSQQNH